MDYRIQIKYENQIQQLADNIKIIIDSGRMVAAKAVNHAAILTYWNVGRCIVEEEQKGNIKAEYGTRLIDTVANKLVQKYGNNYSARRLRDYRRFYLTFNDLEIWHSRVPNLTWTHFRRLMSVASDVARRWCIKEAAECNWSIRTLDRNISTQYYERRLSSQIETAPGSSIEDNSDPMEYLKSPVIAEFLGFHQNQSYREDRLEHALIDNLEKFILELGRGFAFVERQQHVITETSDFFIDLVFYNFKIKRFVIFELKTHKMTHQDVGQLDMYVRMYDKLIKGEDDNPTIGVLLCTETDKTIAEFSVMNGSEQLFASKLMTYMPTAEELTREIERQREFLLQQFAEEDDARFSSL